jgi:hypothetical protein
MRIASRTKVILFPPSQEKYGDSGRTIKRIADAEYSACGGQKVVFVGGNLEDLSPVLPIISVNPAGPCVGVWSVVNFLDGPDFLWFG